MKESYEHLPDEFNFKTLKPKKDKKKRLYKKEKRKKSKLALRLFSYTTSVVLTVSVVTGNTPFVEAQVIKDDTQEIQSEEVTKNEVIDIVNEEDKDLNDLDKEIVQEEETTYELVMCDECEGLGIICPGDPDFGYSRGNGYGYEGCHGLGYSDCPDIWCRGTYKICQSCAGSGKEKDSLCEVCEGDGVVECEFCYGTGIAECITLDSHYTCTKCNGEGQIEIEKNK